MSHIVNSCPLTKFDGGKLLKEPFLYKGMTEKDVLV